tara:strand:- start:1288 stop:1650 length:363 start_codon:yes stop_codon:yes gene_type:complete
LSAEAYSTETKAVTIASTTADANATLVYVCPPNHDATVDLLHIANNNNATKKVYIQIYHADSTSYHYIVKNHSIAGNSAENIFNSSVLHLHAGDKILMYSETTNTIEGILSCKQFFNPAR